jgi:hypothetical protein
MRMEIATMWLWNQYCYMAVYAGPWIRQTKCELQRHKWDFYVLSRSNKKRSHPKWGNLSTVWIIWFTVGSLWEYYVGHCPFSEVYFICKAYLIHEVYLRQVALVVSVLATGPKDRRFEPSQGDGFLRAIKSAAHLPLRWEVKPEGPMS